MLTVYSYLQEKGYSFLSDRLLGEGFLLKPSEAAALITKDPRNKNVLSLYLNGEDLNSRPDQSPSRWVVNFHEWPLEDAESYLDCINLIREKVKPQREAASKFARKEWWLYHRTRPALYVAIADVKKVLVRARIANMHSMVYIPSDWIYSEKVLIFVDCSFAFLQSNIHESWARSYSSTLRTDMQYTPSDCFETFPFPNGPEVLDDIGERYHTHRQSIMLTRQEGLTKTYNRFHNPDEHAPDIAKLRELHKEMDKAVAHAYGWDDLKLEHGFHETKQGLRYTISEEARREVLDRLLLLNHQRHEEEVKAGLFEKEAKGKGKKGGTKGTRKAAGNGGIAGSVMGGGNGVVEAVEGDVQQGTLF